MDFISSDELVLIGPGSEWFWTALQFGVVVVTLLAIYRQLSLQGRANARDEFNSIEREWESERMLRHGLSVLVALREGVDPAHLPEGPAAVLGGLWEKIASLSHEGNLDRNAVHRRYGPTVQLWWRTLAPLIRRWRVDADEPDLFEEFEWFAGLMDEMDRRAGRRGFDEGGAPSLEDRITYCEQLIRTEEALRIVPAAAQT